MNLIIKDLKDIEDKFVSYLEYLENNYNGKNYKWLDNLKNEYQNYLHWTICLENDNIVAFSCIQDHFFKPYTARILTRTWFNPGNRYNDGALWRETPVAPMAKNQLEYLKVRGYEKAFFTLESHRDYRVLDFLCKKINKRTGISNFIPQKEKIQTHKWQDKKDYQWYAVHEFY